MAVTSYYKGQQLGRHDLNIYISNVNDTPTSAAEISYALYDFTTGSEVLVGPPTRVPANPAVGEYFASLIIPLDANIGEYRIRWTFREYVGAPIDSVLMGFSVVDRVVPNDMAPTMSSGEMDMARRLRILLRDNNPDRNYHFRPPTNEETISQYSRVFGFIWEDYELQEYLERSLNQIISAPPQTPFASVDSMLAMKPQWSTLLLSGAMYWALFALRTNWIADEFDYTIGGVSLNLDKSSKYEAAQASASETFTTQLTNAKATVNILKGVQQPRFGTGIRSAFGPFAGRGVLSPRKFVGF
jgi:hypothetical protein